MPINMTVSQLQTLVDSAQIAQTWHGRDANLSRRALTALLDSLNTQLVQAKKAASGVSIASLQAEIDAAKVQTRETEVRLAATQAVLAQRVARLSMPTDVPPGMVRRPPSVVDQEIAERAVQAERTRQANRASIDRRAKAGAD